MKIAIVKLSAMGDIIHAMVVLQYLKKAQPTLQIDWIVEEAFAPILADNPHIETILTLNLKSIKKNKTLLLQEIKKAKSYAQNGYDVVIDAQGLIKSAIVSRVLGKRVLGFDKNSIREWMASYFYTELIEIPYEANVIKRNLKLICEPLGIFVTERDILDKKSFLFFDKSDTLPLLIKEAYIVFVVGASRENKIYPKEKFLEIAQHLEEQIIVVWANDYEKEVATYLFNHLNNVIISPKLTLNQLKMMISQAKLVIGGDTGPTHIAWGCNTPSITIFGNTPASRNTSLTPINRVIESSSLVDALNLDKSDFSIREIEAKEIVKIAQSLLS